ncbi:leucine-rich repeat domain-containing protein [Candidatus Laterigemmans baculatus]|uniref:leucine-rich repeat domain-containing protein n=1 Tax=Candidatus Laterigemmans baculatus TaxID=2770505 RepID=UPI0013DC5607|nr:hypothetical protein [Candidatus Laterigemmans baculatus]
MQSVKRQREAIEALSQYGATVLYNYGVASNPPYWEAGLYETEVNSPVPDWLLSTLGHDHFHSVGQLSTYSTWGDSPDGQFFISRDMLQHLRSLPRLQVLKLDRTPVNDDDLSVIRSLSQLQKLHLGRAAEVTDEGVASLSQLRDLEYLELNYTRLTDKSVEALSRLPRLSVLRLSGQFSDDSLRHVGGMAQLRELTLGGVERTGISNEGLVHLRGLTDLEELNLYNSRVTEEGLRHLSHMRNLRRLDLRKTDVEDASWLFHRLPKCEIVTLSRTWRPQP